MARPVEKDFQERMLSGAKVQRVLETLGIDRGKFETIYNALPRDRQSRADLLTQIAALQEQIEMLTASPKKGKTQQASAH